MKNSNLIINSDEIDLYMIKEKFKSRKNEVYYISIKNKYDRIMPCVLKRYIASKDNKSKETFLLKILRENGLNVPRIYFEGIDYILLEYISGKTLLEVITNLENKQGENIDFKKNYEIICKLLNWLENLYYISKKALGKAYVFEDVNFRNFIIKGDKIYGVDFEDCHCKGHKERDGGRICAFLLTYNPAFTKWKMEVTKLVIEIMTKEFNYDRNLLREEVTREFSAIEKRRGMKIPGDIIKKIF
ncbi:BUD32 family EKC/KEOPS complex subunit [Maledivibacter halophilus]|uniref:Protein kinase domain-containing protein n=1 Tax=Maledivibacter halophilus TaxID=36842 RepID=A0A1T5JDG4_9FIRM|nr:hypothetical protein [Maledivibacter halophilus]SKC49332.1 hypothetical protein SAMN02194393_01107 [Maledivibacter halophilus]